VNKKIAVLSVALLLTLPIFVQPIIGLNQEKKIPNLNKLILASLADPEASDPGWAYDTASAEMIFNVYETLIFYPYEQVPMAAADFQPMLAEEWVTPTGGYPGTIPYPCVAPDAPAGTVETWYFKIRPNVPYHDSKYGIVTPADVEYSIERAMVLDYISGPAWMFYRALTGGGNSLDWDADGDGALSYDEAAVGGPLIDGAVESNSTHVWFNLAISYPPFMQVLAQTWASVFPQAWGADLAAEGRFFWPGWSYTGTTGNPYEAWADYNDPTHHQLTAPTDSHTGTKMMGTGPYKFDYWVKSDTYQLLKFDNYWRGWPGSSEAGYVEIFAHKLVVSWSARRSMFLSNLPDEQADMVDVPRVCFGEVEFQPGTRFVKDLPSLMLSQAIFFNYHVREDAFYFTVKPKLGGVDKPDLFSDKHMRRAFAYALDYGKFLADAFLGEAFQPATPVIKGLPQYNATKQKYDYDLAKVQAELQQAWVDAGGSAWDKGFYVPLTYNVGTARPYACKMIEAAIETLGTKYNVEVFPLSWGTEYIPAMKRGELTNFIVGYYADYVDADNFIVPFMHPTRGTYALRQSVVYDHIKAADFAPNSGRADPATGNYRNWEGKVWNVDASDLNNTYVADLIDAAAKGNPAQRLAIYSEIEDIYYAACASIPLGQLVVRHWERDWVQGWYYNPAYPGLYIYHLWKGLDADTNGDGEVTGTDITLINKYFWDAFWDPYAEEWVIISGPAGMYNRVADINSNFTYLGRPRTWDLDGTEIKWLKWWDNPLTYELVAGYEIPGVDGYVNLYDQALVSAQLNDYVSD